MVTYAIIGASRRPKAGTEVDTETLSAFGTVDYAGNDAFTLSGSLRYSDDTKSLTYMQGVLPTGTGNAALDTFLLRC